MTVWCHLPTIFNQRRALRIAGLLALCVALTTTLFLSVVSHAAPGINQTLSFQGRLLNSSGGVVADGHYNIQFKIYQDGDSSGSGTLKWTESYTNNNADAGVEVKNGYFSVNLGSKNAFGSQVDWNQDTLWLSMNVAGSGNSCTTFSSCSPDGEMLPMKRITSVPFAFQSENTNKLEGKTAAQFLQLAQGVQEDASTNSSIFINKTGTGNLLQLQNTGTDVLSINNSGNILFGNDGNHSLTVATSPTDTIGNNLLIAAGNGGGYADDPSGLFGGNLILQGGSGGSGGDGIGGSVIIDGGAATGSGLGGNVFIGMNNAGGIAIGNMGSAISQQIYIGGSNATGSSTNVTIGSGGSASGGTTTVQGKEGVMIKTNGTTRATFSDTSNTVFFGNGSSDPTPNNFTIQATNSSDNGVAGGSLQLQGGNATVGDANGGNLLLSGGSGTGSGTNGLVMLGSTAFSTTNDDNCYTGGTPVASSCTIGTTSVNNSTVILVGFSTTKQTATLPDPTLLTAGRVVYITGADGSKDFSLSMNAGADKVAMRQNTTTTLMWNGTDWTVAGTAASSALRDAQDSSSGTAAVQVGDGADDSEVTLLSLDKASSAPAVSDDSLLGSMYYDTTLGKVQCYEADGWGACGAAPDTFITLSPEYSNAVMNGSSSGTMSSDICSDTLNINDGSSGQPTICDTNETYNFYKWTSGETTSQTKSIYVTYQLPTNFKNFVSDQTSLMGRVNDADAGMSYQIYRNNSSNGLTACGSAVSIAAEDAWQKVIATSGADPSNCNFAAGDSIVFRINLSAKNDANAYVSNLNFVFSNQ